MNLNYWLALDNMAKFINRENIRIKLWKYYKKKDIEMNHTADRDTDCRVHKISHLYIHII